MMAFLEAAHLFQDCWRLYKKYFSMQSLDRSTWEKFIGETNLILHRYRKEPLAKDILVAVISEIERKEKRGGSK